MSDEHGQRQCNATGSYIDLFVEICAGIARLAGAVKAKGQLIYTFYIKNCKRYALPAEAGKGTGDRRPATGHGIEIV